MQISLNLVIEAALCLLPVALAFTIILRKRKEERDGKRAPFEELRRRPAGEALRVKLEGLDGRISDTVTGLALVPVLMFILLVAQHPKDWAAPVIYFLFSAGSTVLFGSRLIKQSRERANYRLGFEGERFVGEELSGLIAANFEIYHDVPFDGFNMDHVLVGSRGVFVVETKTRRKPINASGRSEFRVPFDGKFLHWPQGTDSRAIEQARNNAKTLAVWLSSATGDNVWVTPILTLPGWRVDRRIPSDGLHVLNPKEIIKVCKAQPERLSAPQVQRIVHQLNQKCRIEVT